MGPGDHAARVTSRHRGPLCCCCGLRAEGLSWGGREGPGPPHPASQALAAGESLRAATCSGAGQGCQLGACLQPAPPLLGQGWAFGAASCLGTDSSLSPGFPAHGLWAGAKPRFPASGLCLEQTPWACLGTFARPPFGGIWSIKILLGPWYYGTVTEFSDARALACPNSFGILWFKHLECQFLHL